MGVPKGILLQFGFINSIFSYYSLKVRIVFRPQNKRRFFFLNPTKTLNFISSFRNIYIRGVTTGTCFFLNHVIYYKINFLFEHRININAVKMVYRSVVEELFDALS